MVDTTSNTFSGIAVTGLTLTNGGGSTADTGKFCGATAVGTDVYFAPYVRARAPRAPLCVPREHMRRAAPWLRRTSLAAHVHGAAEC